MNTTSIAQRPQGSREWGIPLVYVTVTILVGVILPRLEHRFLPEFTSSMSTSAAMGVCSAVASGMIALTGIVFSLAFVMVQFSATAYSPRLVLWMARDPVLKHSLGVFTATFLYALVLLAWVDRGASGKVPLVSSMLVFVLILASMGMFISLIHRLGRLQVNQMLIFTGDHGRQAIAELYSTAAVAVAKKPERSAEDKPAQSLSHQGRPAAVQAIRVHSLVQLAAECGAFIEVTVAVGDIVIERTPMIRVYGAGQPLNPEALAGAVQTGDERTFEQDPKYALRMIVDIAIKALSPAINDPTTAVQALDQIEDLLLRLGTSNLDVGEYCDSNGVPRLSVPFPSWDDYLRLALDEIRFCGANSVQVMRRMNALLKNLSEILPAKRRAALQKWEHRLHDTVDRTFLDQEEKAEASVADRQGLGITEEQPAGS